MLSASLNKTFPSFLPSFLRLVQAFYIKVSWCQSIVEPLRISQYHNITDRLRNPLKSGAGRSSEVERSLMVRWVVGLILHGVDLLSYFSFQPVLHDWCNKGCGMCCPVCGMVHIKEPLLLIGKSSLCGGSGFPFSLSEWSLTICQ